MKQIVIIFFLSLISAVSYAQEGKPNWSLGFNPLALAESQMSLGPAVSYRLSNRFELWTETSYIFANSYMPRQWENMKGFRFILQPRYYMGKSKEWFIAPEFRIKSYGFNNELDFINLTTADTLHAYPFRERQLLIGGALVFGKQYFLSQRKGLYLELTAGLGAKHRLIKRKDIPAGYQHTSSKGWGLAPSYEEHNTGTVLSPLGLRLMWKL